MSKEYFEYTLQKAAEARQQIEKATRTEPDMQGLCDKVAGLTSVADETKAFREQVIAQLKEIASHLQDISLATEGIRRA